VSIRLRLTLVQTVLLGLVLAAFAVIVYATIAAQEMSQLDYELRLSAEDVQGRVQRPPRGAGPRERGGDRFASLRETDNLSQQVREALSDRLEGTTVAAELVGGFGDVVVRTGDLEQPLPLPEGFPEKVRELGPQAATVTIDGKATRILGMPVGPGRFADGALLIVASSLAPVEATLTTWRVTLSLIVLGTTAVAAAIAWFMATSALRPVDQMAGAARTIGQAADFERRLPEPAQADELGRLARTFNEMLEQLSAAYATQRRFLADASHELRTPLTTIATNIAVLRDGEPDPGERNEMLRAVARETDRMSRLVADLLTLARSDAGQAPARRRLAFDSLVLDVYQQQQSLRGEVTLTLGEWEQVEVEADPDRLKQVVLNLVDNALRYTPAGGTVTLDLRRQGDEAVLTVRDTGVGIAPEHRDRIFERFYRVDQPRSRQSGGTGLGLAIAREMALTHGGRIELESAPGAGSTFSLILPVAPETRAPLPAPTPAAPRLQARQPST
jgi:signal transduction histidine kinase